MSLQTKATIDIDAPPPAVFEWLVERDKLTVWLGGAGAMPEDSSQLKVGFKAAGTMEAPDGARPTELEVTRWEPPHDFAFRMTYSGGSATSTYKLTELGSGTHLEVTGETDWGSMAAMPEQVEEMIDRQPKLIQIFAHHQLHEMQQRLQSGEFDQATTAQMQQVLAAELDKLKHAVELFETEKRT